MPGRTATLALLGLCIAAAPAHGQFEDRAFSRLEQERDAANQREMQRAREAMRQRATQQTRSALQRNRTDAAEREEPGDPERVRRAEASRLQADALVARGKLAEAESALEAGIAAHPAHRPLWQRLSYLLARRGRPELARLAMQRLVLVVQREGQLAAEVNFAAMRPDMEGADLAVALAQGNRAIELGTQQPALSPFQLELQSWQHAFALADQLADQGKQLTFPSMQKLQQLHRANQLDAAILLLRFREAYRPELDAWLASHPHAVREFVAIWSLQP